MTISEVFELYCQEQIVFLNQSDKTEEMNRCAMNSLLNFIGEDIDITKLTFDMVRKWKQNLQRTRSQNTVRGYIIKLRVILKYLRLKDIPGIINPDLIGVPKRQNKVVEFISPEEVTKLIEATSKPTRGYHPIIRYRDCAVISLLYASGIRNDELCKLDTTDLRMEPKTFTVIGKGNKARLCFFDDRAKHYIKMYLTIRHDTNPALFISDETKGRISHGTVQEILRNAVAKTDINKSVHPHTLRHSFATNLLANNTNLLYVSKFLGHSSVQTTEMYTHVVDEDLRSIYCAKHTI